MPLLTALRRFWPSRNGHSDTLAVELRQEQARLQSQLDEIRRMELRNSNAWAASRLEHLRSQGTPFYREQAPEHRPPAFTRRRPIPVYTTDPVTKYPFADGVHFEQDPVFGWDLNNVFGADLGSNVPLSAFPREMYPERPSTLRTQIAQDAIRFLSRAWFETAPQYSGPIGHIRNYTLGQGMSINVTSETDEGLAKAVKAWLLEWAKKPYNKLSERIWNAVLNLLRDGENFFHIRARTGQDSEYPELQQPDVSWVRGPHAEITGPWAYGILTRWPEASIEPLAYHLWLPDNSHHDVSPAVFKHAKLDTVGGNVKRGVPLAYKIRKQVPQLSTLLDCMAVGEAARQAIPYAVQYALADKYAVQGSVQSSLAQDLQFRSSLLGGNTLLAQQQSNSPTEGPVTPGTIPHINRGQEFVQPPQGYAGQGYDAYKALCEAIACALNVPLFMVVSTADSETFASALVSESPVVKLVDRIQQIITDHLDETLTAAVEMAAAQGLFPPNAMQICKIHTELPSCVARDRKAEIEGDCMLLDKGIIAPQTVATNDGHGWDEEQAKIKTAKAGGWQNTMGVMPGENAQREEGVDKPGQNKTQTGTQGDSDAT